MCGLINPDLGMIGRALFGSMSSEKSIMTHETLLQDTAVANILACSRASVWRMAKSKEIPAPIRIGGLTRWRLSEIQEVIHAAR